MPTELGNQSEVVDLRRAIQEIYSHAVTWEENGLLSKVYEEYDLLVEKYPWLDKSYT